MNPVLKIGLGFILLVLAVAVFGGLSMPRQWHVEQSLVIAAPPATIYEDLADLGVWNQWTAWDQQRDLSATWTTEGPPGQRGATLRWDGPEIGRGRLVLTEAQPGVGVRYQMFFGDAVEGSDGAILLSPDTEGTRVTWSDDMDMGYNLPRRLMAPRFQYQMSQDLALGLIRLKTRAEAAAAEPATAP